MANFALTASVTGLGTVLTVNAVSTNMYTVQAKMTIPTIGGGAVAQSALVAVVNLNGSPMYTGLPGARGLRVLLACTAGDVITVVFSSAAPVDQDKNAIRATIGVSEGEN